MKKTNKKDKEETLYNEACDAVNNLSAAIADWCGIALGDKFKMKADDLKKYLEAFATESSDNDDTTSCEMTPEYVSVESEVTVEDNGTDKDPKVESKTIFDINGVKYDFTDFKNVLLNLVDSVKEKYCKVETPDSEDEDPEVIEQTAASIGDECNCCGKCRDCECKDSCDIACNCSECQCDDECITFDEEFGVDFDEDYYRDTTDRFKSEFEAMSEDEDNSDEDDHWMSYNEIMYDLIDLLGVVDMDTREYELIPASESATGKNTIKIDYHIGYDSEEERAKYVSYMPLIAGEIRDRFLFAKEYVSSVNNEDEDYMTFMLYFEMN